MRKIFAIICMGALIASCSNDEEVAKGPSSFGEKARITFGSGISASITRLAADSTTFENNDSIRIVGYRSIEEDFALPGEYGEPFMAADFAYKVDSETLSKSHFFSTDTTAYWSIGSKHFFYAWAPVNIAVPAAETDSLLILPAVEKNDSCGLRRELLWARAVGTKDDDDIYQGVVYSGSTSSWARPSLDFDRKLAKIRFRVQYADKYVNTEKLESISFKATNQAGTMNMFNGYVKLSANTKTYVATAGSDTIAWYKANPITVPVPVAEPEEGDEGEEEGAVVKKPTTDYNALGFTPMIYATGNSADVTISDLKLKIGGQTITVSNVSNFKVVAGKVTYVLLTVKPAHIEFSATIKGWEEGESATGDI